MAIKIYTSTYLPTGVADMANSSHQSDFVCTYIPHVQFNIRRHTQNIYIYIPALCSTAPMSIGPMAIRIYTSTHLPTSAADMANSSHQSVLVCTYIPNVQYNICRRI